MIGAGKSTTAERLAAWLTDRGKGVRAFQEGADDHPIRTRAVDLLRGVPAASDPKVYDPHQWDALADRCARGSETVIVESTFLQNSVMPHFVDDAPTAVVKEVFADLAARIAPAAPLLVYLRPSDVAAAIRRVHADRGEPWSSRNYAFVSACPWARRRGLVGSRPSSSSTGRGSRSWTSCCRWSSRCSSSIPSAIGTPGCDVCSTR